MTPATLYYLTSDADKFVCITYEGLPLSANLRDAQIIDAFPIPDGVTWIDRTPPLRLARIAAHEAGITIKTRRGFKPTTRRLGQ
jgi:hypothetical protein